MLRRRRLLKKLRHPGDPGIASFSRRQAD